MAKKEKGFLEDNILNIIFGVILIAMMTYMIFNTSNKEETTAFDKAVTTNTNDIVSVNSSSGSLDEGLAKEVLTNKNNIQVISQILDSRLLLLENVINSDIVANVNDEKTEGYIVTGLYQSNTKSMITLVKGEGEDKVIKFALVDKSTGKIIEIVDGEENASKLFEQLFK